MASVMAQSTTPFWSAGSTSPNDMVTLVPPAPST